MRKEISFEEYSKSIDNKKNLLKNLLPNLIIFVIIFAVLILFIQNFLITLLITSFSIGVYFLLTYLQIKKINKIIFLYEEQDEIYKEKIEIKKYINRLRNLLIYLNLEKTRIDYNINKFLEDINNAQTLEDFKNITSNLKEKIIKYSELLDDNEKDYNYSKSYKEKYAHKNNRDFSFEDFKKQENREDRKKFREELQKEKLFNYDYETMKSLNILELKELPSSKKELKNVYRNLLKKYHPDNINNIKNSFSEKELEKKSTEINEAYDFLEKKIK